MDVDGLTDLLSMSPEQLDLERRQVMLGVYKNDIESALQRLVDGNWDQTYEPAFIDELIEDALVSLTLINYAMDPKDMKRHKEFRLFLDQNSKIHHLLCTEEFDDGNTMPGQCYFSQEEADRLALLLVRGNVEFCMCHLNKDDPDVLEDHLHMIATHDDIFG